MAYELNQELAKHMVKKGDPGRNPNGYNGSPMWRAPGVRNIKDALTSELNEPCEVPGFEHLTKFAYGIRSVVARFCEGDRWAVTFVVNRLFGRVPLDVTATVTQGIALHEMSPEELVRRVDALRAFISGIPPDVDVPPLDEAMDVDEAPQGVPPLAAEPKSE